MAFKYIIRTGNSRKCVTFCFLSPKLEKYSQIQTQVVLRQHTTINSSLFDMRLFVSTRNQTVIYLRNSLPTNLTVYENNYKPYGEYKYRYQIFSSSSLALHCCKSIASYIYGVTLCFMYGRSVEREMGQNIYRKRTRYIGFLFYFGDFFVLLSSINKLNARFSKRVTIVGFTHSMCWVRSRLVQL